MAADPGHLPFYDGPAAWRGPELQDSRDWIYELEATEQAELLAAAEHSASQKVPLTDIGQADFPLPSLGEVLLRLQDEVVNGRGFVVLRGLPIENLSRELIARLYLGIGAWIGEAVPQNAQGHILGHVKDLGNDPIDPTTRIYTTTYRHLFHTDSCDIVALLCLHPAKTGGASAISSSTAIYNEIARQRPDLAQVLAQPFVVDRKGEIPAGKGPTYPMPICHHFGGYMTVMYPRDFIEVAQRRAETPRLTAQQIEAMDLVDALASSDEFRLQMDFRPGDVQFLHNHQILHARTSYEDHPEDHRKRHLLRLWLSVPTGRPLPPVFAERYGEIRVGKRRGGIVVPGAELTAPLEAE
jgi:hypothetical protein